MIRGSDKLDMTTLSKRNADDVALEMEDVSVGVPEAYNIDEIPGEIRDAWLTATACAEKAGAKSIETIQSTKVRFISLDGCVDALKKAEAQLIQISRPRATQLYRWLLETDLALKGSHSRPERARLALETLIFRLSRQARG